MSKIYYNNKIITKAESDKLFSLGQIDLTKKTYFENLEMILCKADGTEITELKEAHSVKINFNLHDMDELEFDLPYYVEQQYLQVKNDNWKITEDYLLIKVNNEQMFVINNVAENKEEINTKHVHAYSKEYLLSFRKLARLQGTRQLYRDGSETTTSKISYSLDGSTWTNYSTPFEAEDGKNILIRRYDHFNVLIGEYIWNNKDKFAQIDGIDITYKDKDVFNKKIEISIRIVSETGEGLLNLLEQETSWKVGYIDIDVREDRSLGQHHRKYRTWDINKQAWSDILYKSLPELFDCIVRVDTINQKINIYHKDKFYENKGLYISKENYLKTIKKETKNDDVITRLRIFGKNNLGISSVNPTGKEYLEDFSYYRNSNSMDYDLLKALDDYDELQKVKTPIFYNYLQELKTLRENQTILENQLVDLQMQKTQKEDSRDMAIQHTEYHTDYDADMDKIEVDFSDIHGTDLSEFNKQIREIDKQIENKTVEISNVEDKINIVLNNIDFLENTLDKKNNFTTKQLEILDTFVKEETWENKNYSDGFELIKEGEKALRKLSKPSVEYSLDIVDFLNIVECQHDWGKLNIGDIINIYYDDFDLYIESKIIKISHSIDENNIDITISNNNHVDDTAKYISDLIKNSTEASNTVNMFKHKWDLSGKNTDMISQIINSGLDSAKNRISSARNQNIIIDQYGIQMKDLFDDKEQLRIINNTIAFTDSEWENCSVAITPKGICAPALYGKIIGSNKLIITNMNENGESSFLVDGSHMTATNMDLSLIRKNLLNRIYMNPEYGFKIQKRDTTTADWEDLLWLDMSGEIYAKSFHVINKDTSLDDNGLVVDNGRIKIINGNKYEAIYADKDGEMRLDGRVRVVRHLSEWSPKDKWDVEPEENRIILLDGYKDDEKGGKLLINNWNGDLNAFLGSPPSTDYMGGFFKLYNGKSKENGGSKERIELGVLTANDTGAVKIKNNSTNDIISLSGNDSGGIIQINEQDALVSTIVKPSVKIGAINDSEQFDGGHIILFNNKNTERQKVFIGIKKEENAGSITLNGKNGVENVLISAIDNVNNGISAGTIQLKNTFNKTSILFSADSNLNPMHREHISQLVFGEDINKPRLGLYSGNGDYGSYIQMGDKTGNPQMLIGNVSREETPGGNQVWYANMTDFSQTVPKRRIQIYVNSYKNAEIALWDNDNEGENPLARIETANGNLIISHKSGRSMKFTNGGKILFS
ncbi:phage tail protein [Clostridium brassicae]|uniref:YOMG-like N-terminal domain-containing protein n=1 Tax=Clostridium brassicae TaxID=2999072 RepID=A0ABT4D7K4_9CLOT|nr:phage tail protein [Clostridium brassicae]MCY6958282.1 hypothetical protein [Clostridium brassicae]